MTFFIFDLRSFILAAAVSALVQAAPWPVHVKHTTHNTRLYARGLTLETYHPKSTFKVSHECSRISVEVVLRNGICRRTAQMLNPLQGLLRLHLEKL